MATGLVQSMIMGIDLCISPLQGVILLVSSMGVMWYLGLENKVWVFAFFIALLTYAHFCGGI